ncbi:hypothetical protein P7C70_g3781, partial [Phenoliferia sp. Uapishka_3]
MGSKDYAKNGRGSDDLRGMSRLAHHTVFLLTSNDFLDYAFKLVCSAGKVNLKRVRVTQNAYSSPSSLDSVYPLADSKSPSESRGDFVAFNVAFGGCPHEECGYLGSSKSLKSHTRWCNILVQQIREQKEGMEAERNKLKAQEEINQELRAQLEEMRKGQAASKRLLEDGEVEDVESAKRVRSATPQGS